MRIAIVTPGFSADASDWCIPAQLDFVRRLAGAEDVHVFALRYPYERRRYCVFDAEVHAAGGGHGGWVARAAMLVQSWRSVTAEHRQAPFDLLHALWADESGWLAVRLGRWLRVPVITSLMGGEVANFPDLNYGTQRRLSGRWRVARAVNGAHHWTTGSHASLDYARRVIPSTSPEVTVIPFGTDPERFTPVGTRVPDSHRRAIVHVGSLTPMKDQTTLLQAFALVAGTVADVDLRIIGEGLLRGSLEQTARSLGVAPRVTICGARPHEELAAWYRGATVCAFSSRYESQSLVVLEAAACGRAIVGTAVGILPELGGAARAVPVADPHALAGALIELLADDEACHRMGEAGRRVVTERFSVEHTVAAFRDLYRRVAAAGPR